MKCLAHSVREAFISIRRNAVMSLVAMSTATFCLVLFGAMLILSANLNALASEVEEQVEMTIYLEDEVEEAHALTLAEQLVTVAGVRDVTYVSKEEALERLCERLGDQGAVLGAVGGTNPLPASLEVGLAWPEAADEIAEVARAMGGVDEVIYAQSLFEQLLAVTGFLRLTGYVLVSALLVAAACLIANAIRLTIFARRREIAIMRLVGATDGYIKGPFAVEGLLLGLVGALVAVLLVSYGYAWLVDNLRFTIPFLPLVPVDEIMDTTRLILLGAGAFMGFSGSLMGVRRFLHN